MGRGITPTRKTGLTCNPEDWSKAKGQPMAREAAGKALKAALSNLTTALHDRLNEAQELGQPIDGKWLQRAIDAHFNRTPATELDYLSAYTTHFIEHLPYRVSEAGAMGVKEATQKKYKTIAQKIRDFERHSGKRYLLKEVDLNFRSAFLKYLIEVDNISQNTAGRYIKFVKTFVLDAQKNGFEAHPQILDFKGFTVKSEKVTLSFSELAQISRVTFEDEKLEAAKDWLIIGCYTGQRVSDLLRMKAEMIQQYGKIKLITLTQQKTGKAVQIPLHQEVRKVLEKRGGDFPPTFAQNPSSNSALFNLHLKTVCRQADLTTLTQGSIFNPTTGRNEPGQYPKWQLVTSHICRRSFATNFYADSSYPTPLLMNITAHSSEKMFLEYIGKPPLDYSLQLAQIWADKEEAQPTQPPSKLVIVKAGNQ